MNPRSVLFFCPPVLPWGRLLSADCFFWGWKSSWIRAEGGLKSLSTSDFRNAGCWPGANRNGDLMLRMRHCWFHSVPVTADRPQEFWTASNVILRPDGAQAALRTFRPGALRSGAITNGSSPLRCDECPSVNAKDRYLRALDFAPFCSRRRGGHAPFSRKRGPTRCAFPAPSESREWTQGGRSPTL